MTDPTDAEIASALRTRIAYHETEADRCRKALALFEDDRAVRRGKQTGGGKQTATSKKKRSGEQRRDPTEGKRAQANARQAEGLAMLKQGKTPAEVAKHFGLHVASVYLWRKKAGH